MVSQTCPSELQLNKANTSNTKAAFLDVFREPSRGKALLALRVVAGVRFLLRWSLRGVMHGRVGVYMVR